MSTAPTLPVTANQLGLTNPKRAHGLALLALGLFLVVLLLIRVPQLLGEIRSETTTGGERIVTLLTAVPPVLAGIVVALWLLYRGALNALAFFVPAGAPDSAVSAGRARTGTPRSAGGSIASAIDS